MSFTPHQHRHAFVLTLIPERSVDAIKSLRTLLKFAGRRLGLRCVDVRECALPAQNDERALAQQRSNPMSASFADRIRGQKKGFFKVADLEGGERTLAIKRLDEELEVFGKTVDVLNFVETGQQLQLNQTTSEWLLDNFGDDPAKWAGQKVTLYLAEYEYNKEKKLGIRLKLPDAVSGEVIPPKTTPARSPNPKGNGDRKSDPFNDEVPF